MFNENYYIEYNRQYIGTDVQGNPKHSVSWITNHWDEIIIDGGATPMTDPTYLAPQVMNFSSSNIYKNFYLENNNFPTGTDWEEKFSANDIFVNFYLKDNGFPTPVSWIEGIDYNNIFSNFSQIYGQLVQADTSLWLPAWSVDGIYTNFYIDQEFYHGLPSGVRNIWLDSLHPEWLPYTPKDINKEITFSGKITIDEKTEIITSTILDRDVHKEQYKDYIDDYWQRRDSNATNS